MLAATQSSINRAGRLLFWIGATIVLGVVAMAQYFGRYSSDARAARQFLHEMPAAQIQEITIEPYTVSSLTVRPIVIRDRGRIEQIAAAFRAMTPVSPNHPSAKWVAVVRFQLKDREYDGQLETTTNGQGGLFWFASGVRGGWNYGCYRNDEIGPFFEQLVAAERPR